MGRVTPTDYQQTEIENDKGQKLPIMNFKMKLEHAVREDIYEYFVGWWTVVAKIEETFEFESRLTNSEDI